MVKHKETSQGLYRKHGYTFEPRQSSSTYHKHPQTVIGPVEKKLDSQLPVVFMSPIVPSSLRPGLGVQFQLFVLMSNHRHRPDGFPRPQL